MQLSSLSEFEWDRGNADKNRIKHGVTNDECEQIFFHIPLILLDDTAHSQEEKRYYALGKTDADRLLFIAFTIRRTAIRVISARDMNKKERNYYVHAEKNSTI